VVTFDTARNAPQAIHAAIDEAAAKGRHYVTITPHKGKRSLEQNALYYARLNELAQGLDWPLSYTRGFIKHQFAAPILAASSPEFARIWSQMTEPLCFVDQVTVARMLPMTSKMNIAQMVELNDEMEQFAAERGIVFTDGRPGGSD